jgi:RNA polymerase sigma-70 factor (ECF subfamily)
MDRSDTLKKLYTSYQPMLLRYACRYLPEHVAEDIVQDCFLKYYDRYIWTTKDEDAINVLYGITHNLCIDYLRHISVRRDYEQYQYARVSLQELLCDPDNGLDYLNEEKLARVRFQITKLSLRQQQILDLYYGQNLQAQEIAARLHLSRRTIENIIYRALLSLRKSL